jgi:hypothetical protein
MNCSRYGLCGASARIRCRSSAFANHRFVECFGRCHGSSCFTTSSCDGRHYAWLRDFDLAIGAALLLAINIVCVNLACNIIFLTKGISPRTWWKKEKAKKKMRAYVIMWVVTLIILMLIMSTRQCLSLNQSSLFSCIS